MLRFFSLCCQWLTLDFSGALGTVTTSQRNHYNNGPEPLQQASGTVTTKARNRCNKSSPIRNHYNNRATAPDGHLSTERNRYNKGAHTISPRFGDNLGLLAALLWVIQACAALFWAPGQSMRHRQAWCSARMTRKLKKTASNATENEKTPCGQAGVLLKTEPLQQ